MVPEKDSLIYILFALLLLATVFTRFWGLGVKPPHHDESMHAYYSYQIVKTGEYQYVPFLHGPFQFYGNALMLRLFGATTTVARTLAAGFGVLAVLLALALSPFMGRAGAFFAGLLLAFSPGFMYFNRFCREDTYYATAILAVVVFLLRYLRGRKRWDLWLAALALGVAYCTKGTFFITMLVFWIFFFCHFLARAAGIGKKPGKILFGLAEDFDILAFLGAAVIFAAVILLLYSSFFMIWVPSAKGDRIAQILNGFWNGTFGSLQYWLGQHSVHRGDQPFYYYFLQLLAYEPLCLLFAIGASVYYLFVNWKPLPLFLACWFLGSFFLFTLFGEKMPWLTVHLILPAALLSGCFLGEIWDSWFSGGESKNLAIAVLCVAALLFSYSTWTAVRLCFQNESDPAETYIYVQSTPDCLEVEKIVREIAKGEGQGTAMPLDIQDTCSWPFAWLFQDFDNRNHPSEVKDVKSDKAPGGIYPVVLTSVESDQEEYPVLKKAGFVERRYKLRAWWQHSWFKKGSTAQEMDFFQFVDWFFRNFIPLLHHRDDMVGWSDLGKWVLNREVWTDKGSFDMRLWVRGDLAKKYGYTENETSGYSGDRPQPAHVSGN